MDWWKLTFERTFDTMILVLAFAASCSLVLHLAHHNMDEKLLSWAQGVASGFGGALLLRLNRTKEERSGADTPSQVPQLPQTPQTPQTVNGAQ